MFVRVVDKVVNDETAHTCENLRIPLRHVSENIQCSKRGSSRRFDFSRKKFRPELAHFLRRHVLNAIEETAAVQSGSGLWSGTSVSPSSAAASRTTDAMFACRIFSWYSIRCAMPSGPMSSVPPPVFVRRDEGAARVGLGAGDHPQAVGLGLHSDEPGLRVLPRFPSRQHRPRHRTDAARGVVRELFERRDLEVHVHHRQDPCASVRRCRTASSRASTRPSASPRPSGPAPGSAPA